MGKVHAAAAASNCRASFPNVKIALVIGVCGVVPFKRNGDEIVLGDVIISEGIIQYDFGRRLPGQFVPKEGPLDSLGRPNQEIRGVLAQAKGIRGCQLLISEMTGYLNILRQIPELRAEYPGSAEDQKSCEQIGCDGKLVSRRRLQAIGPSPAPAIHFGLMASGDSVMKSGEDRDREVEARDIVAFEMEGAGVWDILPCIVIKGACNYADSHKSKVWQRYAAATAAACTKAFLSFWISSLDQGLALNFQNTLSLQSRDSSDQSQIVRAVDERYMQTAFIVPFLKNDLFVGRDDVLARLQGLLFQEGRRKAVLVGLRGISKTQIALQLAYWIKEKKQDYSVFWVPALSRASFEQACVQIIDACDIPTTNSNNADAVKSVRQYLSSKRAGKWLLVVDNADDAQTVMEYLANGQIQEAVKLLEHVVAIREKTLAESHPDRLASQHALAGAYRANGQIKEAVKLLEHVVAIREKTLAESHPDRLVSQHALAEAYGASGQTKKAVEIVEHVVAVETETLAADDPSRQLSKDLLQFIRSQCSNGA
ncbi:hypothetical protein FOTG_16258 [Fusarium oxysporum f. sp. vasinfectum 25433]|uniref:Nucleoside phosphorylase domain-containing protein n=1 Tax=Fusarium oxysporum f. sp. vasinfectum 25433 TaxID=1089449 RepID=X0M3Z6_FUSOX|nr:hypothetical protein FOTG_16258 [Fusarium oxysporum f. sp. vasinfectum 25433]